MYSPALGLGPERRVPAFGTQWLHMRIADDLRKTVVFFGYPDETPGRGGINCIGTGFLISYKGYGYLVTAKHLSHQMDDSPFLLRINRHDGTSENLPADQVPWIEHPDPGVDVSIVSLEIGSSTQYDVLYLDWKRVCLSDNYITTENIGVGNFTYTIGLFRLLSGEKRNLPICHLGSISLMPSDENVPIIDWTDPTRKKKVFVESYLVEAQSLGGLSGSPVFVRPEIDVRMMEPELQEGVRPDEKQTLAAPLTRLRLLGLWQGSWDAPPDEVRAAQLGENIKVGVGMGVVVPCHRIAEVLEMPEAQKQREAAEKKKGTPAASPDSVASAKSEPPTKGDNPSHEADFNRLLDAAARTPKSDDQT